MPDKKTWEVIDLHKVVNDLITRVGLIEKTLGYFNLDELTALFESFKAQAPDAELLNQVETLTGQVTELTERLDSFADLEKQINELLAPPSKASKKAAKQEDKAQESPGAPAGDQT